MLIINSTILLYILYSTANLVSTMDNETTASHLSPRVLTLERKGENLKNSIVQLIIQNKNLKKENTNLSEDVKYNQDCIYNNEVRFNLFNQYSCRENIEINNIPESILQKDLEKYVIAVLHSIGATIELYDIAAVQSQNTLSPFFRIFFFYRN